MRKRLLCILLCLCVVLSMCPVGIAEEEEAQEETTVFPEEEGEEPAQAEEVDEAAQYDANSPADSGSFGKALDWILTEEGILTISGAGDMPDFRDGTAPWNSWNEQILSVMVGEDVTGIGSFAFSGCSQMDTIWLGNIGRIGEGAFRNCSSLTGVQLPEGISRIEANTFENCAELRSISIPKSVMGIGSEAFSGCTGLTAVEIPAGVSTLETNTFLGCTGLREVLLPANLEKIGDSVFENCEGLQNVVLPQKLQSIGGAAFRDCEALRELNLPETLTTIGSEAFWGCKNLKEITLPGKLTQVSDGLFGACEGLQQIHLLRNLQKIGSGAFYGCTALAEIDIPETVTQIEEEAFYDCTALKRAALPGGLTVIGKSLFDGCSALETLAIPEKVTTIEDRAFAGCKALSNIRIPQTVTHIGGAAFSGCGDVNLIDLSKVPQTVAEEMKLGALAALPPFLAGAALRWSAETVPGQRESRKIADIRQENGTYVLNPLSSGTLRLVCLEPVTGLRNSREVAVLLGLEIWPTAETTLVSGENLQLKLVKTSDGQEQEALWSLGDGDEAAASVTQDGLLTAGPVGKRTRVTVTAALPTGDTCQKRITIIPKATAAEILLGGKNVGGSARVDMAEGTEWSLSVRIRPEDAGTRVMWKSDDETVVSVAANGKVTLLKPGNATILAYCTDGSNVVGRLTIQVCYLDAAPVLTLASDRDILETGESAQLTLSGEGAINAANVEFSVIEANMATIDAQGRLTAGDIPGEVNVVAGIKNDPLARSARLRLQIREGAIRTMRLVPTVPDDRGYTIEEPEAAWVCIESGKLAGKSYTFGLAAQGSANGNQWKKMTDVAYESTDQALAAVNADGTVTVKAKREGECYLLARTGEGLEARIGLRVWDTAPRLEDAKLTMNSCRTAPISTGLVEILGNTVEQVTLYDYDPAAKAYRTEPSGTFDGVYEDGILQLTAREAVKNGTYSLNLAVQTAYTTFTYPIQIKIANSLPKVTVRQTEKLNLFYLDSRASLSVHAAGCGVDTVQLTGAEAFRLEEDGDLWTLSYAEDYVPGTKGNPKGTLRVFLDGYRLPVEKAITIATVSTAPKLTLEPGSSILNPAQKPISRVRVFRGGQALDLTDAEVETDSNIAEVTPWGDELRFALTGTKGGTVDFTLRLPNWAQAVKLSRKITIENKLPSLKLRSGTVKLNRRFPWQETGTTSYLTQSNQTLGAMTFLSTAKEGTAQRTEAEKLRLTFDPDGEIRVSFRDAENPPQTGTYGFACRGKLEDGTELPAVNLKVTVADTAPKAKLSAGALRMNRYLAGREQAEVTVSLSDPAYRLAGFRELEDYEELSYENGILTACLTEASKNTTFLLTPIVEDVETGLQAELPNQLKLGLTVYDSPKLGISLSAKGKLDTLVPESAVIYTVTKLSNCQGRIEDMKLEGPDADKFQLVPDTTGAKPVGKLMLLEDGVYDTKQVYQVQFAFALCGEKILSPIQKIRVSQGNLKVTVPKTCNLYLGQKAPLRCTLAPSAPVKTISISYRTDKTFLEALGTVDNIEVSGNQVLFHIAFPGKLKPGKSYAVYLDLTPEHNAVNVKSTQVKLTVKMVK